MRVTLFGASGLLGKELVAAFDEHDLRAPSSRDADIRDHDQVGRAIRQSKPEAVILSAAYTDVDGCEKNRELAFAINYSGAANVAKAAKAACARLIFISTDYVFDGTKRSPYEATDPRNPQSVYGESKARAEESLLAIDPEVCIVRTSWLFGHGGKCFPATVLKLATPTPDNPFPQLSVVNDQRGSPTFAVDLAAAVYKLCLRKGYGIIHATNSGDCTWYEFAKEIVRQSGKPATVNPVTTAEFPRPAKRPAYSVLSPASLYARGVHMPTWQDALQRYLSARPSPA